jgi:2-phosphosulfolactate phosphatase
MPTAVSIQVHFDWGPAGAAAFAPRTDVLVIVDIFSFSTAVDVAVSRGAVVFPFVHPHLNGESAEAYATELEADLAVSRTQLDPSHPYSLWPRSLMAIPSGTRLVLPSPNGSAISFEAQSRDCQVLAACFRNRSAVADAALSLGKSITVIAAGERWPDHSLRPAYEDLLGAGAVMETLALRGAVLSVEASSAVAAFRDAFIELEDRLRQTESSRELVAIGFDDDASIAAQVDVSDAAPLLRDRAYSSFSQATR